jgi:hypothetical protein
MKLNLAFVAFALAASALAFKEALPASGTPEIGQPAPAINGKAWLNHLGTDPNLASLRGQAVLIEFWATW